MSTSILSLRLPLCLHVWLVQQLAFHAIGLFFEWCDRTGLLRPLRAREVDKKSYIQLLPRVLRNQCAVLLPCMALTQAAGLCFTGSSQLPLWRFILSLPAMAIGHDVVQYVVHRHLLHRPNLRLMRVLRHSVHHSTTASRGISACYMSAPDFFLEIVLSYCSRWRSWVAAAPTCVSIRS
jgi:sterol desaturase/sphingolipid hydroxylase (fatty acid hydroxylase superfamily)